MASAACLLARYDQKVSDPHERQNRVLGELAIEQLALKPDQHKALRGCGLQRVAALTALPAAERGPDASAPRSTTTWMNCTVA